MQHKETSILIPSPFDAHVHLRDGAMAELVTPHVELGGVDVALVMPNLSPPLTTPAMADAYHTKLKSISPRTQYLPTMFLSASLTPAQITEAKKLGIVGVKSYPKGVTTGSDGGIESYETFYHVFEQMEKDGLILCLHGEVPRNDEENVHILNAEEKFLSHLFKIHAKFPKLRIILEHATTKAAVDAVKLCGPTVGCTITPHHLVLTIDDVCGQTFNFCKPVAKLPSDREALREVIKSGNPKFFLGSDSAPHPLKSKTPTPSSPCAAGIYTSSHLLPLLANIFELDFMNCLDKLSGFASLNGRAFYGLPTQDLKNIKLVKKDGVKVESLWKGSEGVEVSPFWAGKELGWEVVRE